MQYYKAFSAAFTGVGGELCGGRLHSGVRAGRFGSGRSFRCGVCIGRGDCFRAGGGFRCGSRCAVLLFEVRIVPEDEQPDRQRHDERRDDAEYAHHGVSARKQNAHKPHDRRYPVEYRDGLLLRKSESQQPVVKMPFIRVERALPSQRAPDNGKKRIRQRYGHCEHRHDKGDDRVQLEKTHY